MKGICTDLIDKSLGTIVKGLMEGLSASAICQMIGVCQAQVKRTTEISSDLNKS